MRMELSGEAADFGEVVRSAIESAGGDSLVETATPATDVLAGLGLWELDLADPTELEAAAAACRAAGWWAITDPAERLAGDDDALARLFGAWTLLGMADRVMALTTAYVQDRQQFGKPLAGFQSVQFQLTDAEVERVGLEEVAKHTLWSVATGRPDAGIDTLGLHVLALDAADTVFAIGHQLHGAIGFCDETTISWLSRASRSLRRGPTATAALDELAAALGSNGIAGLYGDGPS